jgi:hypothetical protein
MTKQLGMMPVEHGMEKMWQLSNDGRTVRLSLPGLPVEGVPEPIHVNIQFDASVVDLMIDRLAMLRAQMKPPPPKARKLN